MEAAEWAEQKVEQVQAKREADALRDRLSLKRLELRESHFPELAQAAFDAFHRGCEEYNKRRLLGEPSIGFHVSRRISILKRDAGWSEIWVERNRATLSLRIRAHRCSFRFDRTYRPEPLADGSVVLLRLETQSLASPDGVAQEAIGAFLDGKELGERL